MFVALAVFAIYVIPELRRMVLTVLGIGLAIYILLRWKHWRHWWLMRKLNRLERRQQREAEENMARLRLEQLKNKPKDYSG